MQRSSPPLPFSREEQNYSKESSHLVVSGSFKLTDRDLDEDDFVVISESEG